MIAHELLHRRNGGELRLQLLVLRDQPVDLLLRLAGEDFAHARQAEFLDRPGRLAGRPAFKRPQLGQQPGPFGFREGGLVAQEGLDGIRLEFGQRARPGRVNACLQRQRPARLHVRQRKPGNLRAGVREVLGGEDQVFLLLPIQRPDGARGHRPPAGSA